MFTWTERAEYLNNGASKITRLAKTMKKTSHAGLAESSRKEAIQTLEEMLLALKEEAA